MSPLITKLTPQYYHLHSNDNQHGRNTCQVFESPRAGGFEESNKNIGTKGRRSAVRTIRTVPIVTAASIARAVSITREVSVAGTVCTVRAVSIPRATSGARRVSVIKTMCATRTVFAARASPACRAIFTSKACFIAKAVCATRSFFVVKSASITRILSVARGLAITRAFSATRATCIARAGFVTRRASIAGTYFIARTVSTFRAYFIAETGPIARTMRTVGAASTRANILARADFFAARTICITRISEPSNPPWPSELPSSAGLSPSREDRSSSLGFSLSPIEYTLRDEPLPSIPSPCLLPSPAIPSSEPLIPERYSSPAPKTILEKLLEWPIPAPILSMLNLDNKTGEFCLTHTDLLTYLRNHREEANDANPPFLKDPDNIPSITMDLSDLPSISDPLPSIDLLPYLLIYTRCPDVTFRTRGSPIVHDRIYKFFTELVIPRRAFWTRCIAENPGIREVRIFYPGSRWARDWNCVPWIEWEKIRRLGGRGMLLLGVWRGSGWRCRGSGCGEGGRSWAGGDWVCRVWVSGDCVVVRFKSCLVELDIRILFIRYGNVASGQCERWQSILGSSYPASRQAV
ncbi:hypothetical protein COCVIDRAFT_15473 [Bipolaris victoriae FI3]|uniref:Uncharacterized protein n=1 Tax=Bipolaris victoriae (strain FI3) TaxID=930091 RepID=W7EBD6_BIPV3|nr:hypothetical protein COCVIDRAFT_15473 [Bipolaris victoriae FI3]